MPSAHDNLFECRIHIRGGKVDVHFFPNRKQAYQYGFKEYMTKKEVFDFFVNPT